MTTDAEFNAVCRTEFYETGLVPWPVALQFLQVVWVQEDDDVCQRVYRRYAETKACINERWLREWLDSKFMDVRFGTGRTDVPERARWFVQCFIAVGEYCEFRGQTYQAALLAAVRKVVEER